MFGFIVSTLAIFAGVSNAICQFPINGQTYDLSPLGLKTYVFPDGSLPSVFSYQVQFCQNLPAPCAEASGKSVLGNVYQRDASSAACYQVLSNWSSPVSTLKISNGISLLWHNGDICQGSPIITRMDITCDPNIAEINGTIMKNPSNGCEYIGSFKSKHVCSKTPPGGCVFSGKDLSALGTQTIKVPDNNIQHLVTYEITFCHNLPLACKNRINGQDMYGNILAIQQQNAKTCYGVVEMWVPSEITSSYTNGVLTLKSQNGSPCGVPPSPGTYSAVVNIHCKPGSAVMTGYATSSGFNGCSVTFNLFTDVVC